MNFHGYEISGEWKASTCGERTKGKKGGSTYFLKKYNKVVGPIKGSAAMNEKRFEALKKAFEAYKNERIRVNKAIRGISGPGGNIIIPCEEFVDVNKYVEASEFVDGAVSDKEILKVLEGLELKDKLPLMRTAAGALMSVHKLGIVHGDLKVPNVLLVEKGTSTAKYVAKLIDFDNSYFLDNIPSPADIGGTMDYFSPELGAYINAAEEEDEDIIDRLKAKLSAKSDVFSLGVLFHVYLCGEQPQPAALTDTLRKMKDKGRPIYSWITLESGSELEINPTIDSQFVPLLKKMLSKEPEDRPSSADVLKELQSIVPPSAFGTPYPEDKIVFDEAALEKAGFTSAKPAVLRGQKGYNFYREGSSAPKFMKADMLLLLKLARKADTGGDKPKPHVKPMTPVTPVFEEPWPEDKIAFDKDAMKVKGFVGVKRATLRGKNGYHMIKSDGSTQFLLASTVLLQKLAKKL